MVSLHDLDRKDRLILSELDRDCRQSNAEIARRLRLGKHVVSYRIAQLEKSGAIRNYYAVIDMAKLGRQGYRVYLKLLPMHDEERKALLDYIVGSESTWWAGEMDGKWDLGFVVWVQGHYGFERFWNGFAGKFQKYVESSRVSIYLRAHSYSQVFSGDGKKSEYIMGASESAKVDDADIRILSIVADNARFGTMEIAERAKLSPIQVTYRLKKLVKSGVITGFRANVALSDFTFYKVDYYLNGLEKKKDMLAFARNEKWCVYVDETIGFADFETDLLCPSYSEFKDSVERFKKKFFDSIRGYDFEIYGKVLKVKYF